MPRPGHQRDGSQQFGGSEPHTKARPQLIHEVRLLARSTSIALLPFLGREGSPTKTDYSKKGSLILTSLLEDLVLLENFLCPLCELLQLALTHHCSSVSKPTNGLSMLKRWAKHLFSQLELLLFKQHLVSAAFSNIYRIPFLMHQRANNLLSLFEPPMFKHRQAESSRGQPLVSACLNHYYLSIKGPTICFGSHAIAIAQVSTGQPVSAFYSNTSKPRLLKH